MANLGLKFTLLKQRIIGGGEKESEELRSLKLRVLGYPNDMKKARDGIQHWLQGINQLQHHAQLMAKSVVDSDVELEAIAHETMRQINGQVSDDQARLNGVSACEAVLEAIKLKLQLIQEIRELADQEEEHRIAKNRLKRKIEEGKQRGEKGKAEVEEYEKELEEEKKTHGKLYNRVMGMLESVDKLADNRGGIGFIWPELTAFKRSQLVFMGKISLVLQGYKEREMMDPRQTFIQFQAQMEEHIAQRSTRLSLQYHSTTQTQSQQQPVQSTDATNEEAEDEDGSVKAIALYDYTPQADGDLEFKVDDVILVSETSDDGWWFGKNQRTGKSGDFPQNYCTLQQQDQSDVEEQGDDDDPENQLTEQL